MKVTLDLPDEWADRLPAERAELAQVVAAGLRRRRDRNTHLVHDLADVVDALAELPSPEEVLALRPSSYLAGRIDILLERRRSDRLTSEEAAEWEEIMRAEHLTRIAKAKAAARLKSRCAGT
jgi:hypothetical protein